VWSGRDAGRVGLLDGQAAGETGGWLPRAAVGLLGWRRPPSRGQSKPHSIRLARPLTGRDCVSRCVCVCTCCERASAIGLLHTGRRVWCARDSRRRVGPGCPVAGVPGFQRRPGPFFRAFSAALLFSPGESLANCTHLLRLARALGSGRRESHCTPPRLPASRRKTDTLQRRRGFHGGTRSFTRGRSGQWWGEWVAGRRNLSLDARLRRDGTPQPKRRGANAAQG
jgi:hypothetical protein